MRDVILRRPEGADARQVHQLIENSESLDKNSFYCYALLCSHFRDSCAAAEHDGKIIGFMSAYRIPGRDTLFVWQAAVDPGFRGQGLSKRLLHCILEHQHEAVQYIEMTISPTNTASQGFAKSVARDLHTGCFEAGTFLSEEDFPFTDTDHESELLFRIGPLS